MDATLQDRIATRLKALREERGLSQQDLADALGFNNRQTLAAIENRARQISPQELARAAKVLEAEPDFFTDAFRLAGEGSFSFRAKDVPQEELEAFEDRAGRWIATYRTLSAQAGVSARRLGTKLDFSARASFEEAQAAAEELREAWRLGDVPAAGLEDAIRLQLGALVLYVDAPAGLSGAASYLPGLHTILVNRLEPEGRRYYDLAHELFHLLTWDAMPPDRVEPWETPRKKGNRVEQLAENFAAALLMPADTVESLWAGRGGSDIHDWLNATATALRVSSVALKWRVHNLGLVGRAELSAIDDASLAGNGGLTEGRPRPQPFSADFVGLVHQAVEAGRLSLRKAARLLGMQVPEFADLCAAYGRPLSYEIP